MFVIKLPLVHIMEYVPYIDISMLSILVTVELNYYLSQGILIELSSTKLLPEPRHGQHFSCSRTKVPIPPFWKIIMISKLMGRQESESVTKKVKVLSM